MTASRRLNSPGALTHTLLADENSVRLVYMFSQWVVIAGVMLVFGPAFAAVATTLIPGKENWPCSLVKTRWPLSQVGKTSSKDVSSRSLNLWESMLHYMHDSASSVEATASPLAIKEVKEPSWTSGHLSYNLVTHVTANFRCPAHPASSERVAQIVPTKVSPSLWDGGRYGNILCSHVQLLFMLRTFFPAFARALTELLWSPMANLSNSPKFGAASHVDNLMEEDPNNDGEISSDDDDDHSDESDDAITSYAGSAPSSPIQSFGTSTPALAPTHLDNSQFSTIAQVGTPNIIRQAQSVVTSAPSIIRDARLSAAPYMTPQTHARSGPAS